MLIQLSSRFQAPAHAGRARLTVTIIFFIHGLLFANWAARLPALELRYGLSHRELGQLLLCSAVGAWSTMPLASRIIQRLGSGPLTAVGIVLFCGLIPGMALLPTAGQAMLLFLLLGAATGLLDVAMNAQAIRVEQLRGQPIMSSFHAAFSLGGMLGAGLGALSTRLELGLAPHLLLSSALSLLLILPRLKSLLPDEPVTTLAPEPGSRLGLRLPSPVLLGLGFIAFCCMLGEGAMADWSTIYLVQNTAASAALAPLGYAAFSLAMGLGRLLGDQLMLQVGPQRLLVLGGGLALGGLLIMLLLPQPISSIASLFLVGLGLSTIVPTVFSAAGQQPGLSPGAALGIVSTVGYGGFLLGPPLIGWLADLITLRYALGVVAAAFALLVVVALSLPLVSRRAVNP
jgi:MFS family permease